MSGPGLVRFADLADVGDKRLDQGSHRTVLAAETFKRIWPHRALFGLTRIANVTGLDRIGIPVALAIRPNARSVAVSQGKGVDLASAKASALMEAAELWHAEEPHLPLLFGSFESLQDNHELVADEGLPLPEGTIRTGHDRVLWTSAEGLASGRSVHVPYEMVHADYAEPVHPGHGLYPASTNGLASGNHPLEAVCHGLFEVIERDALSLWHALPSNIRHQRRVKPESIDGVRSQVLLERFDHANVPVVISDITSDLNVATFLVFIGGRNGDDHVGLGSGTHLDRDVALARALSEAAQTRMTYITGSRDDLSEDEFSEEGRTEKADYVQCLIENAEPARSFGDTPSAIHPTLRGDLDALLARFDDSGLPEPLAVDLSRSGLAMSVVRVIAPGLEAPHDDPGYQSGPRARTVAEQGA